MLLKEPDGTHPEPVRGLEEYGRRYVEADTSKPTIEEKWREWVGRMRDEG